VPKLSLAWDGITVECLQVEHHAPDVNPGFVVSLAIAHQPIASQRLTSHLHLTVNPDAIKPHIAKQIQSMTLPFNYSQTVSNPSILHLLHLLQTEMQVPQLMNQMFVSAIVTVLTIHILQNFQREHCNQ
jgi:hypothetical protein